jgi:HSP90 family molecular chaperone
MSQNLTLEINPNHPLIVQLNNVRRTNQQVASTIAKALLDNCLLVSGLLEDP